MFGKRPGISGKRQHRSFGKTHVHENIIKNIHPPGDHHIASSRHQFQDRQVDGGQGTGAGRVGDTIGAAQIKTVGDASGHHVAEQPRKRIFLPGDIGIGNFFHDIGGLLGGDPGVFQGFFPVRKSQPGGQGNHQFLGAGHPQNHPGVFPVPGFSPLPVAGILQRHAGGHQPQQLGGVGGFENTGRHAEFRGIKRERRQKPPALAIGIIAAGRVLAVIIRRRPVRFLRHIDNRVFSPGKQTPVFFCSRRPRKKTTHPHNRHCLGPVLTCFTQCSHPLLLLHKSIYFI